MKKIRSLFLVVALVLFLSGCYDYKIGMTINEDKSVKLAVDIKIDTSMLDEFGDGMEADGGESTTSDDAYEAIDEAQIQKLKERGYAVVSNKEGSISTISVSKTFSNIDDISIEEDVKVVLTDLFNENFDDSRFFKIAKNFGGNIYTANFVFQNSESGESGESMGDLSAYESMFNLSYTVTLPEKSISNNATTVSEDGKTLTWKLSIAGLNEINYEFKLGSNNMLMYVLGGVGLLAIIGIIVVIVIRRNKKQKNLYSNINQPVIPQQPIQPIQPLEPQQPIQPIQSFEPQQQMTVEELLKSDSDKSV